ncbi:hypothetical protein J6590_067754 [Homalodisca vitripennis]|nr:hypothetical protein J6590_067754 [Homalodisca vitripennis]
MPRPLNPYGAVDHDRVRLTAQRRNNEWTDEPPQNIGERTDRLAASGGGRAGSFHTQSTGRRHALAGGVRASNRGRQKPAAGPTIVIDMRQSIRHQ